MHGRIFPFWPLFLSRSNGLVTSRYEIPSNGDPVTAADNKLKSSDTK